MGRLAREAGWHCFWGAPLESRSGGIWGSPQAERRSSCDRACRRGRSCRRRRKVRTRWRPLCGTPPGAATCWWAFGTGATVLHAQAAYCVSGQPALNRAFWQQAVGYAARHGAALQLIGGDLNFPLHELLQAPPTLQRLLLTRRLVDADSQLAAAGRPPLCSYVGVRGGRPTRIDGLMVDTRLAALLRGSGAAGVRHPAPSPGAL